MFPNVNSSCHFYIYNIDQIDDYTSSYSSRITVVAGIKTLAGAIATTTADPFITYDGTSYYSPGTKFTISNNGTPNGYTGECQGYKVTDISGTDITSTALSGSELTLPANGNVTVRALFDLVTYNITYDLDGGQFNSGVHELSYPSTYTVESGTLTMPLTLLSELLPHKDGYIFAGWTGPGYDEPTKTIIIPNGSYGDRTYTANWQRESYTISYKLVGGTLPPGQTNPTTYNVDTPTFTLVNPTREGYDFLGWIDMRDPMLETKPTITITQGSTGSKSYRAMWTPSESIPVTAHQPSAGGDFWATFYHADANYQVANGVTIYKGAISGSNLTLTDVTGNRIIPAGQAVVLKYTGGSLTMTKTTTDATGNYDDNDLMGGSTVTDGYTAYTLADGSNGVGFYRFTGAALNPNKAHLEIPQTAGARTFYSFSDDATAIEAPEMVSDSDDGDIYDLMGRKLQGQPTQKGIYVKQGKKYIVK